MSELTQNTSGDGGVTLTDLHAANIARQAEWCPDQLPDLSFRGNELAGETGEACNVIKKLERERQGWRGSRATVEQLAEELADVVICADLCAVTAGINLDAAVRDKFNATSEKVGLTTKLAAPAAKGGTGATSLPRFGHIASGREYEVVCENAQIQTNTPLSDYDKVVVYRGIEPPHLTWVRPVAEFNDGRFKALAASPPPPAGAAGGGSGDLGALSAGAGKVRKALLMAREAVMQKVESYRPWADKIAGRVNPWQPVLDALDDALTEVSAPTPDLGAQGEPVAWAYEWRQERIKADDIWHSCVSVIPVTGTEGIRKIRPLYEAPAASRIRVTEEEIARAVLVSRGIPERFTDVQKEASTDAWVAALRDARAILNALRNPGAILALLEAPATPRSGGGVTVEGIEAASAAYYDGMIGREEDSWPHHLGWAGKSEAFKDKVRAHMARALKAALLQAPRPGETGADQ